MSAATGLDIGIHDAKQAFSNGRLTKPLYMRYPKGTRTDGVIKIIGALEGLKESNELWYKIVDNHLRSLGFKTTPANPCLYVRDAPKPGCPLKPTTAFVLVHVDDFMITASANVQQEIYRKWPFEVKISCLCQPQESGQPTVPRNGNLLRPTSPQNRD